VLVDELWAGEPPDGAATTLRSYVSRLRTALGGDIAIGRGPAGYVLDVPADAVDVVQFERQVRTGRTLVERGRHRRAAQALTRALELWRGTPFAGLADDGALRGVRVRLEELRLLALESRYEAALALGQDATLVDELEGLVEDHPFRERLWRHLMLALYRAGRQADALAAYHRARSALDEQLGIEPSEDLQTLEAAILRQDVPPPTAAADAARGLPVALTSFVGRSAELDDVLALLRRSRLVSLVGVGGVGKTRLAIEVARRAVDDLIDSVVFVDLAALQDPAHVVPHVASTLGLREEAGRDLGDALQERIAGSDLLIVLDNCEHVRAAAAELSQRLLASTPELRILATSREVLDVPGEAPYPVPPLGVPDGDGDEAARASEAVRLLVDRATLVRRDLRVDDATWETAARICRDLEGLPLAIELAAARAKALSLDEIAERIQDRFRFLVSWRRLSAARHRTLAEAMDWSYELLATDEQQLLARLSVFPAGATLASVAEVCLDGDTDEAERLLERLVDASLVVPRDSALGTRYRLLETVRQYAAGQLAEADVEALNRRHAQRARAIAQATHLSVEGTGQMMSFELAHEELASIRAAIRWAIGADPSLGLEIACGVERMWVSSYAREGVAIFTELLEQDVPDALRARGLRCRGGCRFTSGQYAASAEDYEAALEIHRRAGEQRYVAHLMTRIAVEAERSGDVAHARALIEEAAALAGEDRVPPDRYVATGVLADLAFREGRVEEGMRLLEREEQLAAEEGDEWWQLNANLRLADRLIDAGRLDQARRAARMALQLARKTGGRGDTIFAVGYLAVAAADGGQADLARRLWGGIEAELDRGGPIGQWDSVAHLFRARTDARGAGGAEAQLAQGRRLTLEQVLAEAQPAD
jgi:predicted ATPase/DNA-binding SARP family transcriptional activator